MAITADYQAILDVLAAVISPTNTVLAVALAPHSADSNAHHSSLSALLNIIPNSITVNGAGTNVTLKNATLAEDSAAEGSIFKLKILSSIGTTLATVDSKGNIVAQKVTVAGTGQSGTTTLADLVVTGSLTVNGNTTLGDSASDTTTIAGGLSVSSLLDAKGGITNTASGQVIISSTSGAKVNNAFETGGTTTLGKTANSNLEYGPDGSRIIALNGTARTGVLDTSLDLMATRDITRSGANGVFAHVTNGSIHVTAAIGAGLAAASPAITATNPPVTVSQGDGRYAALTHSQDVSIHITQALKDALNAASPVLTVSNFVVGKSYADANYALLSHVGNTTHVTAAQRAALDAAAAPATANPFLTLTAGQDLITTHAAVNIHLTAAERLALTAGSNTTAYSGTNPVIHQAAGDLRYALAAQAGAGQADNLLLNSSFERWIDGRPFHWELSGVTAIPETGSNADPGLYAARLTATAANGALKQVLSASTSRFLRSKSIVVGVTVTLISSPEAKLIFRDSGLGVIRQELIAGAAGTYTRTFTLAVPAGVTLLSIELIPDAGGSLAASFDTVHLREGVIIGSWSPSPLDAADAPGFFNRAYHAVSYQTVGASTTSTDITSFVSGIPISDRADREGLVTFTEGSANLAILLQATTGKPILSGAGDLVYGKFRAAGSSRFVDYFSFDGSTEVVYSMATDNTMLTVFTPRIFKLGRVPAGLRIGDLNAIMALQLLFLP